MMSGSIEYNDLRPSAFIQAYIRLRSSTSVSTFMIVIMYASK